MTRLQTTLTRFLLIGSFISFTAGAATGASGGIWNASQAQAAGWILANPGSWTFLVVSFVVSLVLAVAGLGIFSDSFLTGDSRTIARTAFYIFMAGAMMWIVTMGFRLGVLTLGAEILVETGAVPAYFDPLSRWEAVLFDIFEITAFLASTILGLALLRSNQYSRLLGWFAVIYGILAVIVRPIPIMTLIVPLALGLAPYPDLQGGDLR